MALSSDSTCVSHLYSAQHGFETLHMEKIEAPQEDTQKQDIMVSSARCEFPKWMIGDWEGLTVGSNGEFTFRDEVNFVTYRGHCVTEMPPAEKQIDGLEGKRYLLYLTTDCGSSFYSCALFQRRDKNVLEFQLGKSKFFLSTRETHDSDNSQELELLSWVLRGFMVALKMMMEGSDKEKCSAYK